MSPATRKRNAANAKTRFTIDTLEKLADDLQKGRLPLDRVTVSDELTTGLRAIVRNTGLISFHVQYDVGGSRPYLKIGDHPGTTIPEARELANIVHHLAGLGIDPQDGLHDRLVRELKRDKTKWRPK